MARKSKPLPVYCIEIQDGEHGIVTWYVRDRLVIDCTPGNARAIVGTRIARIPEAGDQMRVMPRHQRGEFIAMEQVVFSVNIIGDEQAKEVMAIYRDTLREIINDE